MAFFPDFRDMEVLPLRDLEHLLDLAVYGKHLLFFRFGALSRIETVPDFYRKLLFGLGRSLAHGFDGHTRMEPLFPDEVQPSRAPYRVRRVCDEGADEARQLLDKNLT